MKRPQEKPRWKPVCFILFIGCTLLGGLLFLLNASENLQTKVLADGTVLTLRGVAYGTNELRYRRKPDSGDWAYFFRKLFLKEPVYVLKGGDDGAVRILLTQGNQKNNRGVLISRISRFEVLDSKGHVFSSVPPYSIPTRVGFSIITITLTAFPRCEETFRLRLYDKTTSDWVEFNIRNPELQTVRQDWIPQELPATKTNGGLIMTLNRFRIERDDWGAPCLASYDMGGSEATNLSGSVRYWFSDSTGNVGRYLNPEDSAWDYHIQFYRGTNAVYPSNLIWRLPEIQVPGKEAPMTVIQASNTFHGIQIWAPVFCRAGKLQITNHTSYVFTETAGVKIFDEYTSCLGTNVISTTELTHPFLVVETGLSTNNAPLFVRLLDSNGRIVGSSVGCPWYHLQNSKQGKLSRVYCELKDADVTTVIPEIIVNQPIEFTFRVKPPK